MSKSIKKWIKRVLLWGIGLPVLLIVGLFLLLEIACSVAPEKVDENVFPIMKRILKIEIFDEQEHDLDLIIAQLKRQNYDSVHVVCDSLEGRTKVFKTDLHLFHAAAYQMQKQYKAAEFQYRKSIEAFSGDEPELTTYAHSVMGLSRLLTERHDYAEALEVLMPAMKVIKAHESSTLMLLPSSTSSLYTTMGNCLVELGRYDEGDQHYHEAIDSYERNQSLLFIDGESLDSDTTFMEVKVNTAEEATLTYIDQQQYDKAGKWFSIARDNYRWLKEHVDINSSNYRRHTFAMALAEARLLHHQGRADEAYQVFLPCLDDVVSLKAKDIRECGQFLLETGHWQEVIGVFHKLDSTAFDPSQLSLEDINQILVPQYRAWRGLANSPKALLMADSISGVLDSAIVRWRNSDALELATIYDTQGKEALIAQKEASLTRLWWIATMVVLALVVLSFAIYTVYRRRVTKMQAIQERIESELRVARDIQMSMVPSIFPEREGMDMFASMTPAKEVGGDLYGYLLIGDRLYFAIGDVSGKGVLASLFMAQATRLFLTLAKQGMMPAEICTRMNDALSGDDNENGMFVTFWIGLADLQTGHLDFCNAGHNPPVIGNGEHNCEFMEMQANAPIGLFPGLDYEGEQIENIKGRQLFIYTDGLNEAEDPQQDQFGDDRLIDIIRSTPSATAHQTIDTILAAVEAHRKGAEPNDDLTMMCVKIF